MPAFTLDPALQPRSCVSTPALVYELTYFNPSFKFPRNLRLSLGTDIALPWDLVGTVDLLYIRGVDQLDVIDVNLEPPDRRLCRRSRTRYCTARSIRSPARPRPTGGAATSRVVDEMRNSSGDRSVSASGSAAEAFPERGRGESGVYLYRCQGPHVGQLLLRHLQPLLHARSMARSETGESPPPASRRRTRSPSAQSSICRSACNWVCSTTATRGSRIPIWSPATRMQTGEHHRIRGRRHRVRPEGRW